MNHLKKLMSNQWQLGKWQQFSLGLGIAAFLLGSGTLVGIFFLNHKANQWGQNLRYYSELYPKSEAKNKTKDSQPPKTDNTPTNLKIYLQQFNQEPQSHKLRIQEQLGTISSRAKTHLRSTKDFYIWSSLVLGIAQMGSVISASCLLHITRKGWENSNSVIKGIFVTSAGTVAFCSSCIFLYEYEQNTASNAALYVYYVNLEDDVMAALATQSSLVPPAPDSVEAKEATPANLKSIILEVQKRLNDAHTLDIEFDLDRGFEIEDFLQQSDDGQP